MKHPAIDALYEVVPAWKHEELANWLAAWVDAAWAKNTTYRITKDDPRRNEMIPIITNQVKAHVANLVTEGAVMTRQSWADGESHDLIVSASAYFLLPRAKK